MDTKELRTLQLLDEIEKNHMSSQRQLARQLNISLGLVNSFIKRLAQKGYFKVTHIPKNRVKYILTPKGATEKTRLTYEYIKYSYSFYKDARRKLRKLFLELESQGVRSIVFYGASDLAEIAYLSLQETGLKLYAIVDDSKVGEKFIGFIVNGAEILDKDGFDKILVTAIEDREAMLRDMAKKKIDTDRIAMIN